MTEYNGEVLKTKSVYTDEMLREKTKAFDECNQILREYRFEAMAEYIGQSQILDVGCGNTYMLEQLVKTKQDVHGVDPDLDMLKRAKERAPEATLHLGRLEDVEFPIEFGTIICSHVIEHVSDPYTFLTKCYRILRFDGYLIVTCPNALSLHKRLGAVMGLGELYSMSATDEIQDHEQIFDMNRLEIVILAAGFEVVMKRGLMLKPFPCAMMSDLLDREWFDAFWKVGEDPDLIDYCSSIMIVGRKR